MIVEQTEDLAEAAQRLVSLNNFPKEEMRYILSPVRNYSLDDGIKPEHLMFSIRSAIRAKVSHSEAVCFFLRSMVLATKEKEIVFTNEELLALMNKKRNKSKPGHELSFFPDSKSNIKLSFQAFSKVFAPNFTLDLGCGWGKFLEVVEMRNRLTHPKELTNQLITDDEYRVTLDADEWFTAQVVELLSAAKEENPFLVS